MKTLLVNPASWDNYWSFPEGCRILGKKTLAIPLGLITVAALLPSGWPLRLVDLAVRDIGEEDWRWADVVMISAMLVHHRALPEVIARARQYGKKVVVGGPYASSLPKDAIDIGADIVMRGEAENQMPALLKALAGSDKGVVIETDEKPLLATSPVPRFDLLDRDVYLMPMIQTSRGCPFDCEFCDVTRLFGRRMRHKDPSQVLRELESLRSLGWRGHVFVADDNFIGNRKETLSLLKPLTRWQQRHGEPFSFGTQASINLAEDLELIDRLTAANFGEVFIGIESPDNKALQKACKYQNLKSATAKSINTIRDHGMLVTGSFIIGMDNEEKGVGERICTLVEQTGMPCVMINLMGAAPETRLWHRLERERRLRDAWEANMDSADLRMNFVPTRPLEEIQRDYVAVWDHLYRRDRYLQRCFNYFLAMRPTRAALASNTTSPESGAGVKADPRAKAKRVSEILMAVRVLFDHGIRYNTRFQFWYQLFSMLQRNPSRIFWYMSTYMRSDDMARIRTSVIHAAKRTKAGGTSKRAIPAKLRRVGAKAD